MKDLIIYYEIKIYVFNKIIKELGNLIEYMYNNGDKLTIKQRIKELEELKESYKNDLTIIKKLGD